MTEIYLFCIFLVLCKWWKNGNLEGKAKLPDGFLEEYNITAIGIVVAFAPILLAIDYLKNVEKCDEVDKVEKNDDSETSET